MSILAEQPRLRAAFARLPFFAGVWWILALGDASSWRIGLPAVLLATWVSVTLAPLQQVQLLALPYFLARFLWLSTVGAVDVALKAFAPGQRLAPTVIEYHTQLPAGLPRVFFANAISLTPGTLSADLQEDRIRVHLLDGRGDPRRALTALENAVARVLSPP